MQEKNEHSKARASLQANITDLSNKIELSDA
jgi:hypothetical protein